MPFDRKELEHMVGADLPDDVPPFCPTCGYNLTGAVSERCPECGHFFDPAEWQRNVAQIKSLMREAQESIDWVPLGLKVALAGVVARLLGLLAGTSGYLIWFGRGAAFVCGFWAFFSGLGVLRVYRLPAWARDQLSAAPYGPGAAGAILIGALLMATSALLPW